MYIAPNSVIRILRDVPLDNNYNHTLYWTTPTAQTNYFIGKTKHTLTGQSYQRVNKGIMRVQIKAEDLYDCNYIMFQNTSFGSKWFYAFLLSVNYVNNVTAEIEYQIDVMQTWHFHYDLGECFVVREHASEDYPGSNLLEENVELGDYYETARYEIPFSLPGKYVVFGCTFNNDEGLTDAGGQYIDDSFSGLKYHFFPLNTDLEIGVVQAFIDKVVTANKWDGIITCFMSPFRDITAEYAVTIPFNAGTSLGSYTPRNKKLLTYPYNLLHIYTHASSADYRYEYFTYNGENGVYPYFQMTQAIAPTPSASLIPLGYNTWVSPYHKFPEHRLTISGFPQCAIPANTYQLYLAENANSIPTKLISDWANLTGSLVSNLSNANPFPGLINTSTNYFTGVAQFVAKQKDIQTKPPQVSGTQLGGADWDADIMKFTAVGLSIQPEFARVIDDYFDMFGYATNRVKRPNRAIRPYWTYTKTVGCIVLPFEGYDSLPDLSAPADDAAIIANIYDKGVTFWRGDKLATTPNLVGNYSLDNRV